jgi:hypothetical protein
LTQLSKSQLKFIEQGWIERLGRNDKNGTLADELELNRRTTLAFDQMPTAANALRASETL